MLAGRIAQPVKTTLKQALYRYSPSTLIRPGRFVKTNQPHFLVLLTGFFGWTWLACPFTAAAARSSPSPATTYRAVLDQYCVICHNDQLRTAGLSLAKADVGDVSEDAATWEKVLDKLQAAAMPPPGVPRPDPATYRSFATYLEASLDRAAAAHLQPGRPAVHRLNRAEYHNAIRDLLGVDVDVDSLLPPDDSGYGFDNIADLLSVSPLLLERYVSAAGKISRLAIGDPTMKPALTTYEVPPLLIQDERMSEELPFGSRGGTVIRHNFPVDGTYDLTIRLQRDPSDRIFGLTEPHEMDVLVDGARVKTFTVGGGYTPANAPTVPAWKKVEDRFHGRTDAALNKYESTADANLELRFPVKAGSRLIGITFQREKVEPEGALQAQMVDLYPHRKVIYQGAGPAVAKIIINGPYDVQGPGDTPSRHKIFVCRPKDSYDETACAAKILATLARRAYRRPVTNQDLKILLGLYKQGRSDGHFEAGIGMALQGMLVNPEFLFRVERDPANLPPATAHRISDLELASRLSFFLWSSMPDDELLGVASAGKLKNPMVLEQEVRRMLADSRSAALVDNFAGQWLYVRNMRKVVPDPSEFFEFNENLRRDFEQETNLFFESNLREDKSVLNLLDADYTFLNERLARFYGVPGIYGSGFRRVALQGDERRGLLGEGSILTVTSYANRTSPTVRGKWVMENILGTPPPPPPPNVPSLKEESADSGKVQTMRERMEEHRSNPACASCHTRMDPIGFALENFDGVGKWRTAEGGTPIDPAGVLPDGVKFDGPAGLRKILLSHPDQFATTVTEKLLTYALGRGLEYYDAPVVRKITRDAASGNYRWSALILGIVKSVPFQMRMTKPQEPKITTTMSQVQGTGGTQP